MFQGGRKYIHTPSESSDDEAPHRKIIIRRTTCMKKRRILPPTSSELVNNCKLVVERQVHCNLSTDSRATKSRKSLLKKTPKKHANYISDPSKKERNLKLGSNKAVISEVSKPLINNVCNKKSNSQRELSSSGSSDNSSVIASNENLVNEDIFRFPRLRAQNNFRSDESFDRGCKPPINPVSRISDTSNESVLLQSCIDSDESVYSENKEGNVQTVPNISVEYTDNNFTSSSEVTSLNKISTSCYSDSDGESEKCPICMACFNSQEVGNPAICEHSFCAPCIVQWTETNNTCPVDRLPFQLIIVRSKLKGKIIRKIPVRPHSPAINFWDYEDSVDRFLISVG